MSTQYIQIDGIDNALATATENARERRDELVLHSAKIRVVKTAEDAQTAADALKDMKGFTREIEDARTAVGAPVLKLTKEINGLAKELTTAVEAESTRVARLLGTYQQEQQRLANEAAEAARAKEQQILQKAQDKALDIQASGRNVDAKLDNLEAKTFEKIADVRAGALSVAQPAIAGIASGKETIVEVIDLHALYKARPELVKLELNLALAKATIKASPNIELPGLKHYQQAKVSVRG